MNGHHLGFRLPARRGQRHAYRRGPAEILGLCPLAPPLDPSDADPGELDCKDCRHALKNGDASWQILSAEPHDQARLSREIGRLKQHTNYRFNPNTWR